MYIIIGLVVLCVVAYMLWDVIFYIIGGILGLLALACSFCAIGVFQKSKMSPEQWKESENKKYTKDANYKRKPYEERPGKGVVISFIVLTLIFGGFSYASITYQQAESAVTQQAETALPQAELTPEKVKEMSDDKLNQQREAIESGHLLYRISFTMMMTAVVIGFICLVLLIPSLIFGFVQKAVWGIVLSIVVMTVSSIGCAITQPSELAVVKDELKERKKIHEEEKEAQEKQKQYEEWIAWQKSEEEKRLAEEKERNKYVVENIGSMIEEYESNPSRARNTYRNKYVKISGWITRIIGEGNHFLFQPDEYSLEVIACVVPYSAKGRRFKWMMLAIVLKLKLGGRMQV